AERADAILGGVVAELGAGDTSAANQTRQRLEFLVARLESPVGCLGPSPRFGISMKADDDIRGNSRRRQHRVQILQPALIQVRDAAADDVALESKRSDGGMDLPDRFGKILRAGRIAVVRDVWLVANLQRVLLQTGGSCRLHDAPRAGGE